MIFTKLMKVNVHHDELGKFRMTHFIQEDFWHASKDRSIYNEIVEYPIFYSEKHDIYLPGKVFPMGYPYYKAPEKFINRLNQFETGEIGEAIMSNTIGERLIPVISSDYEIESWHCGLNLLVGKAGVGKSHLIRSFCDNNPRSIVKLAPTAMAAINIGGATIHSFFNLPPKMIDEKDYKIITKNKKYSSFDSLIIDEISMVPGYIIDAIDKILRANNDPNRLFGGKTVFGFGDLLQLEPIPSSDKEAQRFINDNYNGSYWFFDSKALEDKPPDDSVYLKIYPTIIEYSRRHAQSSFIKFLDIVRKGKLLESDEEFFYEQCSVINQNPKKDNTIYLTTKNITARAINNEHLEKLNGEISYYESRVSGDWTSSFPNDKKISLKVGAEIIFIKNDQNKKFINGEKGKIKKMDIRDIVVEKDDGSTVYVGYSDWENVKYKYNTKTKTLESVVIGTFSQLPIKLGWAITIHKSQGMTLNHISLFLNDTMFAKGMLYVALSRVRDISDIYIKEGKMDFSLLQSPDISVTDFMKWMGILNA